MAFIFSLLDTVRFSCLSRRGPRVSFFFSLKASPGFLCCRITRLACRGWSRIRGPFPFFYQRPYSSSPGYDLVLGANRRSPHCELKFRPFFGTLFWASTWKQVHIMSLDRPVINLCWRVSHGVLYTAERLVGFGYNIVPNCLCGHPLETLYPLFFLVSALPEWYLMGPVSALPGCAFGTHPDNSPSSFWFLQR